MFLVIFILVFPPSGYFTHTYILISPFGILHLLTSSMELDELDLSKQFYEGRMSDIPEVLVKNMKLRYREATHNDIQLLRPTGNQGRYRVHYTADSRGTYEALKEKDFSKSYIRSIG